MCISSAARFVLFFTCGFALTNLSMAAEFPHDNLVDVSQLDPTIVVDARYFTKFNFTGRMVPAYEANKCFLTEQAAKGLLKAQAKLIEMGLSLKVYDCYRPQDAVNAFVDWAKASDDHKIKAVYYPFEVKTKLFERGYIAEKSGHSRGSTIDLSIVPVGKSRKIESLGGLPCFTVKGAFDRDGSLNMGTTFDCFDERSNTVNEKIESQARANRLLLKSVMEQSGFKNYDKEWWHYTLVNEPFPDTYFNRPIR